MNKINNKILDIMMNTLCNSFFYWDITNNSMDITAPFYGDDIHVDNADPITRLINKQKIPNEDIILLERLRDKILAGTKAPISENVLSVQVRILDAAHENNRSVPWYKITFYLHKDKNGLVYEASALMRELTEQEIMNKEILESFSNDQNPRIFNTRISNLIKAHPEKKFAFVQFDIRNFKFINETYGDEFGNEILNYIFNTLKYYSSETFISSRLTADVFMFITAYTEKQEVIDFVNKLNMQINHYKDSDFRVCFGINFAENLNQPPRYNGDCAAIARFTTKADAVSIYTIYDDSQRDKQRTKGAMEEKMKKALANKEFVMYLQPKYNIQTKKVCGAEALSRWITPDGKITPPLSFIPLAEENGFIKEIDYYIWEEACKTIRDWIDNGKTPIPISINVSRVHLENFNFINKLNELISEYDLPKNLLEVEITETIQNNNTDAAILEIKNNGYTLLMDDFGSGYSSLKMMNNTHFDVIKIDRSFLSHFMISERGKKIISHTIDMSQDIGIDIIAEGVENEIQEEFLLENGCRYAQGFLFSKPIPVDEFNKKYMDY